MLRILPIITLIFLPLFLKAQDSIKYHRIEIGLNISNVLANFFNSDFPRAEQERHSLALKYNLKDLNKALRLHLGGGLSSQEVGDVFGFRIIEESSLYLKAGFEWRKNILPTFSLIYGTDLVYNSLTEESRLRFISDNNSVDVKKMRQYGSGGFIGFRFVFGKRFALTTESHLSVLFQTEDTEVVDLNQQVAVFHQEDFQISHTLPLSLYLYIRL